MMKSVAQVLARVKDIRSKWAPSRTDAEEIWFRGVSNREHQLLPKLYRSDFAAADEESLLNYFKGYAAAFETKPQSDEWDWYFLAQHYGLPTRLLDWTKDLLVATYFALEPHARPWSAVALGTQLMTPRRRRTEPRSVPAIWMMDAGTLNRVTTDAGFDGVVLPGRSWAAGHAPSRFFASAEVPGSERGQLPIAVFPAQSNARIIPQHGTFTLHGDRREPIEALARRRRGIRIARIDLDPGWIAELWDEALILGVHPLKIYPGLDTAAEFVWKNYLPAAKPTPSARGNASMKAKGPGKGGGGGTMLKKKSAKKKATRKRAAKKKK